MMKFSDFGLDPFENKAMFLVPQISITDIINCEIIVLDYEGGVETSQGADRYIVKIEYEGKECKFFTTAKPIKEMLDKIPKDKFPFSTTIKQQKLGMGNNKTYVFT